MIKRNRVVITGMGVVAPNGIGLEAFWNSLLQGRSGIGPITLFDASNLKSRIAGEVKNFDPQEFIEPESKPKRMARHTQFAYAAAMMAMKDAGLKINACDFPSPTPVIVGVSTSAMDVIEREFANFGRLGPQGVSPITLNALAPQAPANAIADRIGICANAATVSSACPSGLDAVALAASMIGSGEAELAIAGGSDASITEHSLAAFIASGLTSSEANGHPERASRPFDLLRRCGVLSEGAGIFVLENMDRALARGARTYIELGGFSRQRDSEPGRPASGLIDSMRFALANSAVTTSDIDFISAYGTGDPYLDAAEVSTIKEVFHERAYSIPITSIKGVTGNPLAAGGALQIAACALSIRDQLIPPIANYEVPDPACDLDFVAGRARRSKVDCALINVRGLGGSATSAVVKRAQDR
jgi:3-oxoacyl-[acyl-carrier-protein] synthase II